MTYQTHEEASAEATDSMQDQPQPIASSPPPAGADAKPQPVTTVQAEREELGRLENEVAHLESELEDARGRLEEKRKSEAVRRIGEIKRRIEELRRYDADHMDERLALRDAVLELKVKQEAIQKRQGDCDKIVREKDIEDAKGRAALQELQREQIQHHMDVLDRLLKLKEGQLDAITEKWQRLDQYNIECLKDAATSTILFSPILDTPEALAAIKETSALDPSNAPTADTLVKRLADQIMENLTKEHRAETTARNKEIQRLNERRLELHTNLKTTRIRLRQQEFLLSKGQAFLMALREGDSPPLKYILANQMPQQEDGKDVYDSIAQPMEKLVEDASMALVSREHSTKQLWERLRHWQQELKKISPDAQLTKADGSPLGRFCRQLLLQCADAAVDRSLTINDVQAAEERKQKWEEKDEREPSLTLDWLNKYAAASVALKYLEETVSEGVHEVTQEVVAYVKGVERYIAESFACGIYDAAGYDAFIEREEEAAKKAKKRKSPDRKVQWTEDNPAYWESTWVSPIPLSRHIHELKTQSQGQPTSPDHPVVSQIADALQQIIKERDGDEATKVEWKEDRTGRVQPDYSGIFVNGGEYDTAVWYSGGGVRDIPEPEEIPLDIGVLPMYRIPTEEPFDETETDRMQRLLDVSTHPSWAREQDFAKKHLSIRALPELAHEKKHGLPSVLCASTSSTLGLALAIGTEKGNILVWAVPTLLAQAEGEATRAPLSDIRKEESADEEQEEKHEEQKDGEEEQEIENPSPAAALTPATPSEQGLPYLTNTTARTTKMAHVRRLSFSRGASDLLTIDGKGILRMLSLTEAPPGRRGKKRKPPPLACRLELNNAHFARKGEEDDYKRRPQEWTVYRSTFLPFLSPSGQQPCFLLGLGGGTVVKLNSHLCTEAAEGAEDTAAATSSSTSLILPSASDVGLLKGVEAPKLLSLEEAARRGRARPKRQRSIKDEPSPPIREFFFAHKARIVALAAPAKASETSVQEIVTVDAVGKIIVWHYSLSQRSGFGTFTPVERFQLMLEDFVLPQPPASKSRSLQFTSDVPQRDELFSELPLLIDPTTLCAFYWLPSTEGPQCVVVDLSERAAESEMERLTGDVDIATKQECLIYPLTTQQQRQPASAKTDEPVLHRSPSLIPLFEDPLGGMAVPVICEEAGGRPVMGKLIDVKTNPPQRHITFCYSVEGSFRFVIFDVRNRRLLPVKIHMPSTADLSAPAPAFELSVWGDVLWVIRQQILYTFSTVTAQLLRSQRVGPVMPHGRSVRPIATALAFRQGRAGQRGRGAMDAGGEGEEDVGEHVLAVVFEGSGQPVFLYMLDK
ncbi:unnamed protein product [Vitrella brassicaformis CCMP3155]|uniref:Uncharacterized protein n=4 Tax=Vitrella brassicaformis TaxID=1169539 RepID=A0A0G4G1L9_VITBC|nr:unnamed protein product [Vitrella brassicaformis CCMP3155]|eukprot:CEM21592.1 unnamed protein product [Vitrella brassicaformis CCMP3155]